MLEQQPERSGDLLKAITAGCRGQVLWIVLLALTSALVLFPVRLRFEYHAVESLYIFGDRLWLFIALYVLWMAALLLLLFSRDNDWQRIALLSIFSVVFLGFSVIQTPLGSYADGIVNLAHVKYLEQVGFIPFNHPTLVYFQFPGLHLFSSAFQEVLGLDLFTMRTIVLVLARALLAVFLFFMFRQCLKHGHSSSFAVLLLLHGNFLFARTTFHPQVVAYLYLIILITMLYLMLENGKVALSSVTIPVLGITFIALTVTYLPIPAYFLFILVMIYVFQLIARQGLRVLSIVLSAFVVFFLCWQILWATSMFSGMLGHLSDFISSFSDLPSRLLPLFQTASINLGESVPLWFSLVKLFWLAFFYLLAGIIAIRALFKIKGSNDTERIEYGGFWAVVIFSIVIVLSFPYGTQQYRILMYAPLFTAPIIVHFLVGEKYRPTVPPVHARRSLTPFVWLRAHAMMIVLILLPAVSIITFLSNYKNIETYAVYGYEHSAGEFVENTYGTGQGLVYISDTPTVYINTLYVPDAMFATPPNPWDLTGEQDFWDSINRLTDLFETSQRPTLFTVTEKFGWAYASMFKIEPSDPRWQAFTARLSENCLVYDDGHTMIYSNAASPP